MVLQQQHFSDTLETRGKAQRDSPVPVLLAPTEEYDWMITLLVPYFQIPVEKTVGTTVQSKFNNVTKSAKVTV